MNVTRNPIHVWSSFCTVIFSQHIEQRTHIELNKQIRLQITSYAYTLSTLKLTIQWESKHNAVHATCSFIETHDHMSVPIVTKETLEL